MLFFPRNRNEKDGYVPVGNCLGLKYILNMTAVLFTSEQLFVHGFEILFPFTSSIGSFAIWNVVQSVVDCFWVPSSHSMLIRFDIWFHVVSTCPAAVPEMTTPGPPCKYVKAVTQPSGELLSILRLARISLT